MTDSGKILIALFCCLCATHPQAGSAANDIVLANRKALLTVINNAPNKNAVTSVEGYHIRTGAGYVIVSDLPETAPRNVTVWEGVLQQATHVLKREYFTVGKGEEVMVYLFRDKTSYAEHVQRLWNEPVVSPYGYYIASENRIVCNGATGPGTLVHELVHALMEPDFPDAPVWLSEGMASLYEHSDLRNNSIRGLDNWRLPDLQTNLDTAKYLLLTTLFDMSYDEFSANDISAHYAEARYFCMFLEEKGLLRSLYADMRNANDHGGSAASLLEHLYGAPLTEIEQAFRIWAGRRGTERMAEVPSQKNDSQK